MFFFFNLFFLPIYRQHERDERAKSGIPSATNTRHTRAVFFAVQLASKTVSGLVFFTIRNHVLSLILVIVNSCVRNKQKRILDIEFRQIKFYSFIWLLKTIHVITVCKAVNSGVSRATIKICFRHY